MPVVDGPSGSDRLPEFSPLLTAAEIPGKQAR
jgi:hypothetical protein